MSKSLTYTNSFQRLSDILDELREKCPWDRKQTIDTLRVQTIEELYELTDALVEHDWNGIKEELGDLLLHLFFYSKIAKEQGKFDMADVVESICNKLVSRHPHVYGALVLEDEQAVKQNWEKLKLKEGRKSVLEGVPQALPAMAKALRLQEKAKQVGFEWDHKEEVYKKVQEEQAELASAIANGKQEEIEEEFGDLLFSLVNYARFVDVEPERALQKTNSKFKRRFEIMEELAADRGMALHDMDLAAMDLLWNEAKSRERLP